MKEYSNLAEINTETIPNTVISDLASLLYEVFCEKKQSQEKTAKKLKVRRQIRTARMVAPLNTFLKF